MQCKTFVALRGTSPLTLTRKNTPSDEKSGGLSPSLEIFCTQYHLQESKQVAWAGSGVLLPPIRPHFNHTPYCEIQCPVGFLFSPVFYVPTTSPSTLVSLATGPMPLLPLATAAAGRCRCIRVCIGCVVRVASVTFPLEHLVPLDTRQRRTCMLRGCFGLNNG